MVQSAAGMRGKYADGLDDGWMQARVHVPGLAGYVDGRRVFVFHRYTMRREITSFVLRDYC